MKVVEDIEDFRGNVPIRFSGYKNLREVRDYLWEHFNGYMFVAIFDCTKDEYEDLGNELAVYFADTVLDGIAYFYDEKLVKNRRMSEEGED